MTAPHTDLREAAQAFLDAWEKWRCRLPDTRDVYRVDDAAYALKDALAASPSPAMEEYDYELALMLWPFVNAKELSEDKFAKIARKSFAAFTRDHHRDCMAAWKVYYENRRITASLKSNAEGRK